MSAPGRILALVIDEDVTVTDPSSDELDSPLSA
jgi:hypothetical protein